MVLLLFVSAYISYYRRKYQEQDTTVFVIQLRPDDDENKAREKNNQENNVLLNTMRYNKILFGVMDMVFYAVFSIIMTIIWLVTRIQHKKANETQEKVFIIYYFHDFLPWFIINVIFPCIFFIRNRRARDYVKTLFVQK